MGDRQDTRIVYGARCSWWDSIDKVGLIPVPHSVGLPCCPHCQSPLFEIDNEAIWFASVDRYEANGHPGYRAMVEWGRGKCFPSIADLFEAYRAGRLQT